MLGRKGKHRALVAGVVRAESRARDVVGRIDVGRLNAQNSPLATSRPSSGRARSAPRARSPPTIHSLAIARSRLSR